MIIKIELRLMQYGIRNYYILYKLSLLEINQIVEHRN